MQDYRVELDAFSGPMDLLLFLVKREEVDLRDISVARLTEQYLAYLKQLEAIDVNLAGEFLVMAATLLELKSQMLIPQAPPGEAEGERSTTNLTELDPRRELVAALLAYKRFKDSAMLLEQRAAQWSQRYPSNPYRSKPSPQTLEDESQQSLWEAVDPFSNREDDASNSPSSQREFDLEDANILDLAETFARVMESIGRSPAQHEVLYDDTPIGLHAEDILDRLGRESTLTLQNIFEGRSHGERIGLFLALLELVRQRRILVQQEDLNRPIQLSLRTAESELTPDPDHGPPPMVVGQLPALASQAPTTADFDWPDEESKLIALRREKLRFKWSEKKKSQEDLLDAGKSDAIDPPMDENDAPPDHCV